MMEKYCTSCGSELKEGAKFCHSCGKPQWGKPIAAVSEQKAPETPTLSQVKAIKQPMSKTAKTVYALIAIALFGVFAFLFMSHLPGGAHPVIANQPDVAMATMYMGQTISGQPISAQVENGKITFPLSLLLEKKMVEFEYKMENTTVPLLAFISSEGKLVTAIRVCEPCNSRTFRIEETELACGNCETRWKLNNLEGLQGSCQKYAPDPIPSTIVGNQVQIDESVVKNWKLRI